MQWMRSKECKSMSKAFFALAVLMSSAGIASGQKKAAPAPATAKPAPAQTQTKTGTNTRTSTTTGGSVAGSTGAGGGRTTGPTNVGPGGGRTTGPTNNGSNVGTPGSGTRSLGIPGNNGIPKTGGAGPVSIKSTLPVGNTRTADGGHINVKPDGTRVQYGPTNKPVAMQAKNMSATFNSNGRLNTMHRDLGGGVTQTVRRGPGGVRITEGVHPAMGGGQVRVVGRGPHDGFVERPIYGRPGYMRRSYLRDGHSYAVVYRGYRYHGIGYYRPVPAYVYSPAYYGWAVQRWDSPVVIQVGFVSQPWYGAYGNTFAAYPQYYSADQWMTDQILASNMQQAYEAGREAGAQSAAGYAPAAPPAISPELKQQFDAQVAQEVQEQSKQATVGPDQIAPPETANEPDSIPDALKHGHTVFRVVAQLDVESDGEACTLNSDDWIIRNGELGTDGMVAATVAATRSTDCAQGAPVRIALNDLMTMQNEEDQQIQEALKMASLSMGKGGMPAGPPAGAVSVPGGQAQPDQDVAANIQKEQVDAETAEKQATVLPSTGGQ